MADLRKEWKYEKMLAFNQISLDIYIKKQYDIKEKNVELCKIKI